MIYSIKGLCEYCGFAYCGNVECSEETFAGILCPNCHCETENFDDADSVDRLNEYEGNTFDYVPSTFEVVTG
jgi:hypothetical protein